MGANVRLDCLEDVIRQRANLSVECECGHMAILDAKRLNRWALCHQWSTQLINLHRRLKCRRCRGRPSRLRATYSAPCGSDPFPNDETGWEELLERLRR